MTIEDQQEILKDWLKHPGTRLMAYKLRAAAKGMLKEYDTADPEKVGRIQTARFFLNSELPRLIEAIMNAGEAPKRWKFWTWMVRG